MKALFLPIVAACAFIGAASAQTTAFTYQGRMSTSGNPASGVHDLRFRLFDAASGGAQVGPTLCADNLAVNDGYFVTTIDFGQQFATPAARFLEIQVRADTGLGCGDATGFTTLSPRQPITPTPMASHAKSAFSLDAADGAPLSAVSVDNDGNVGIGTTSPTAKLDVRGGAMLVEHLGDQADLLWLSSERSWVFRQEGVGAAAALKLQSVGGGGNKNLIFQTDGAVGIRGTSTAPKWVATGDEVLRIIRGTVRGDGVILQGAGFHVSRLGAGDYFISFDTPFSAVPTATSSSEYTSAFPPSVALPDALIASSIHVVIKDAVSGALSDRDFHFIVVGPR